MHSKNILPQANLHTSYLFICLSEHFHGFLWNLQNALRTTLGSFRIFDKWKIIINFYKKIHILKSKDIHSYSNF